MGQITKNITKYMNSSSVKQFTVFEVSLIRECIRNDYDERKKNNIIINTKTKEGRNILNKRVADLVNNKMNITKFNADDIRLYKKCFASEYSDRTGKCAYGYKDVRIRYGYDPITAIEISADEC